MPRRSKLNNQWESLREQIIGLGEKSLRKSYYPELQHRLDQLERFRYLLDKSNDAIFIIQVDSGDILDVNESACRHTGYSHEELTSRNILEIFSSDLIMHFRQIKKDKKKAERANSLITAELYNSEQRKLPFEISIHIEKTAGETLALVVARDISDSMKAEQKYTRLYESLQDGFARVTIQGEIVEYNEAFRKMLGYTKDEMKTRNLWNITPPRWYDYERKILNDIVLRDGFSGVYEKEYLHKDGHAIPVELRTYLQNDERGQAVGFWAFIYDISERKKVEASLIKAKEEAEKANSLKSEFLAQMSHEIRTPINSILNFTNLIKEEIGQSATPDIQTGFNIISRASKRLIRTIDLLLNMSELQTGTYEYNPVKIDLYRDCLLPLYADYKVATKDKGIELRLENQAANPEITGDEYTVQQIFYNLIDNAVKYTPLGSVEIIIFEKNSCLGVEIRDTGIGISEEFIPHLFTPFTQEEQGYTRRFDGNGLGLALVKKYCELNKAKLEVESTKGTGSVFRIIFQK